MTDVTALATQLDDAATTATATPQLTAAHELTLHEAYDVQRATVARRVERGDVVVGVKLGFTSRAKAEQMGVSDVIAGVVTEAMRLDDGGTAPRGRWIHPRIEPEVAFRLGAGMDADLPDDAPPPDDVDVAPALEIIDSRYRDFRFSLEDVVADNASAAGFVVGGWRPLGEAGSLADLPVTLAVDGQPLETGSTADILGDPLRALAAIRRMARRHGYDLAPGTIVLAGAATAAVPLPGEGATVTADVEGLGRVSIVVGGGV